MLYKAPKGVRRMTQADYRAAGRGLAEDCAEDFRRGLVNISFDGAGPAGTVKLLITFANRSTEAVYFPNFAAAHEYARDNISYSSGAVVKVDIWCSDSETTVFNAGWNDESNRAAMALRW